MRKIIINGRFLDQPMTGVQRYALQICRVIDRLIAQRRPVTEGLSFEIARPLKGSRSELPFSSIREARFGRFRGQLWEQLELPRHAGSAVVMNLCNLCPLLARRNLTVVHDANVWLVPDNYTLPFRAAYRVLLPLGIKRSRIWITVSRYSAEQLRRLGISDRAPAAIIGSGADHMRDVDASSRFAAAELPRPFVFALGSRSRNKNVDLVYALAPRLGEMGISVVVAGDPKTKVFVRHAAADPINVIELGRVADADLAYLYRECLCFLFPSWFEGFGIPPLEAMAVGAPVVSSNSSSLPEILGEAALFCPPNDPDAWIGAVALLHESPGTRSRLAAQGPTQAAKYQWNDSAMDLLQWARRAAE